MIDKIIWKDGHVTTIASKDAFLKQFEVATKTTNEWHIIIGDSEFIWKANCWMEI